MNWDIIGHDKLLKQLETELASNSLSHSMLLSGEMGVGKTTILKKLARFLQSDSNPDVLNLDTMLIEDNGESLKIAEVRKIKEFMQLSRKGEYKITIIVNIERMTIPASNSLLKILEEPPEKAMFLLSSSQPDKLLDTIVSRCRLYKAESLSLNNVRLALRKLHPDLDDNTLNEIMLVADGQLGKSIQLIEQADLLNKYKTYLNLIHEMHQSSDLHKIGTIAQELASEDRKEVLEFLDIFLRSERARHLSLPKLLGLEKIQQTINLVKQNVNTRLSLEVLFLQYFTELGIV